MKRRRILYFIFILAVSLTVGERLSIKRVKALTLVVTNNLDAHQAPPGSLRAAMEFAQANPGPHEILFNIDPPGAHTIILVEQLPSITQKVTIDGTTQPGYNGRPLIELDGSLGGIEGLVLEQGSAESRIRGLTINHFVTDGIFISSGVSDCLIEYCFIGTDSTGTTAAGNGFGIITRGPHTTIRFVFCRATTLMD